MPPEGGRAGARKEGDLVPTGATAAEAPVASLLTLISRSLTITGPPARRDKGVFGCWEADVRKVCHGQDLGQFCSLLHTLLRGSVGDLKETPGVRALAGTARAGTVTTLRLSALLFPVVRVHFSQKALCS